MLRFRTLLVGLVVGLLAGVALPNAGAGAGATTLTRALEKSPFVVTTRTDSMNRFADVTAAEAAGYVVSSVTSPIEHWLNPGYFNDGHILDPERPEGLVYLETGHGLRLVAAMS